MKYPKSDLNPRAEDLFSPHDWAVVEFLERVSHRLIRKKVQHWRDQCAHAPDEVLRHNLTQAFRYIALVRDDQFLRTNEREFREKLRQAERLPSAALQRALGQYGHLLFNSYQYAIVRAFGASSLVPMIPGYGFDRHGVPHAMIQAFFSRQGLPYYLNPDFLATYESQLLPCSAGLTPYHVTLFELGHVQRVTGVPNFLGDLSILHKREDFVQGHLSALVAVLGPDEAHDVLKPKALGAYVLTCVVPDAFSEVDLWRLNQIVDGVLKLGMLPALQRQQQWVASRGTRASVFLPASLASPGHDLAEAGRELEQHLKRRVPSELETGLLALAANFGSGEETITSAAVNLDGIYRLLKALFPTGPWLAPSLVCESGAEYVNAAESQIPLNTARLRLLCSKLVSVFESGGTDSGASAALFAEFPLFRNLIEAIFPELIQEPGFVEPSSLIRVWHSDAMSPEYALLTIGRIGPDGDAPHLSERLSNIARLASVAARLASMPEGENRIFADVERSWIRDYSTNPTTHGKVDLDDVIAQAEQFLRASTFLKANRSSELVKSVRDAMLAEIHAVLARPDGVRALLLVKKRTLFIPDSDGWADEEFSRRYLAYASFWLFERLSQIFGTHFLDEGAFDDPAIPRIGPFIRRQEEYPHVEVATSTNPYQSELVATLLSFLGVPVSKWEEGNGAGLRILVGNTWFTDIAPAYRHYLNLLMRSAPSVGSISRLFFQELLSVQLEAMPAINGAVSRDVRHDLIINRPGAEPERRSVLWRAHPTVEVELGCLSHEGIFEGWTEVASRLCDATKGAGDFSGGKMIALQVGDKRDLPEAFVESVRSRFESAGKLAGRAIDAERNRSRLEQEKQIREKLAEMVGLVGHDLKNPINVLIGNAGLLEEGLIGADYLANVVRTTAEYMLALVINLVDAYRINQGKLEVTLADVSLMEIVTEVCKWFTPYAAKKKITIENRLQCESDLTVVTDAMLLRRILFNLIDNAIKYIPQNAVITIDAEAEQELVNLRVSDTGNGISEEKLSEMFRPFVRGDGEAEPGIGLGLPGSRQIAELMGGTLTAESPIGSGTTFHLRLPTAGASSH
jgi:signal transduction histidine kinase